MEKDLSLPWHEADLSQPSGAEVQKVENPWNYRSSIPYVFKHGSFVHGKKNFISHSLKQQVLDTQTYLRMVIRPYPMAFEYTVGDHVVPKNDVTMNSEILFEEVSCRVRNSNVKCFIVQLMHSYI